MVASRHQNVGQNHSLLIPYKSSENVANLKYMETKVTNQKIACTTKLKANQI